MRHHYSNPGYSLLGALVEKVRGAGWADVLRREILEPLGMYRTSPQPQAPHAGAGPCIPGPMSCCPNRPRISG